METPPLDAEGNPILPRKSQDPNFTDPTTPTKSVEETRFAEARKDFPSEQEAANPTTRSTVGLPPNVQYSSSQAAAQAAMGVTPPPPRSENFPASMPESALMTANVVSRQVNQDVESIPLVMSAGNIEDRTEALQIINNMRMSMDVNQYGVPSTFAEAVDEEGIARLNPYRPEILNEKDRMYLESFAKIALDPNASPEDRAKAIAGWIRVDKATQQTRENNARLVEMKARKDKVGYFTADDRIAWYYRTEGQNSFLTEWSDFLGSFRIDTESPDRPFDPGNATAMDLMGLNRGNTRQIGGWLWNNLLDTAIQVAEAPQKASESFYNLVVRDVAGGTGLALTDNLDQSRYILPNLAGGLVQFYTAYGPLRSLTGIGRASAAPSLIQSAVTAEVASMVAFDPRYGNLSTLMVDFGVAPEFFSRLDARAMWEKGSGFKGRLAAGLEGLFLGLGVEGGVAGAKEGAARSAPTVGNGIRFLERMAGLPPDQILKSMPPPVRNAILSRESASALAALTEFGVGRSKRMGELLAEGKTSDEALLIVQREYPLSTYADGVRRVTRAMIADSFQLSPREADVVFGRFASAGLDWERIFFTLPDEASQRMHKLLYQTSEGVRKARVPTPRKPRRGETEKEMDARMAQHRDIDPQVNVFAEAAVAKYMQDNPDTWWTRPEIGGGPSLSPQEIAELPAKAAAMVAKAWEDRMKAGYPVSEGWMQQRAAKPPSIKLNDEGELVIGWSVQKEGYTFALGENGEPLKPGSLEWVERREGLARKIAAELRTVNAVAMTDSGPRGDRARAILAARGWYQEVATNVRGLFGPYAPMFAELLGALSARTDVTANWRNMMQGLQKFTSGHYDGQLGKLVEWRMAKEEWTVKKDEIYKRVNEEIKGRGLSRKEIETIRKDRVTAEIGWMDKPPDELLIRNDLGLKFNANSERAMDVLLGIWALVKMGDNPKTKNFAQNLLGQYEMATIDVWAARALQRMAGMSRLPANLTDPITAWDRLMQSRFRAGQRLTPNIESGIAGQYAAGAGSIGRTSESGVRVFAGVNESKGTYYGISDEYGIGAEAMADAVDLLKSTPGFEDMTPADLQAVLWFSEKDHWIHDLRRTDVDMGDFRTEMRQTFAGEAGRVIVGSASETPMSMPSELGASIRSQLDNDTTVTFANVGENSGNVGGMSSGGFVIDVQLANFDRVIPGTEKQAVAAEAAALELDADGNPIEAAKPKTYRYWSEAKMSSVTSRAAEAAKAQGAEFFYVARITGDFVGGQGDRLTAKASKEAKSLIPESQRGPISPNRNPQSETVAAEFEFASAPSEETLSAISDGMREFGVNFSKKPARFGETATEIEGAQSIYIPDFDPQITAMAQNGADPTQISEMIAYRQQQFMRRVDDIQAKLGDQSPKITKHNVELDVYQSSQFDEMAANKPQGDQYAPEEISTVPVWKPKSHSERIAERYAGAKSAPDSVVSPTGSTANESVGIDAARTADDRIPEAGQQGVDRSKILFSAFPGGVGARGVAAIEEATGIAFVAGLRSPDITTAAEEFAHALRNQVLNRNLPLERRAGIPDATIDRFERAYGVQNGVWTVDQEEAFAADLLDMLADGTNVPARLVAGGVNRDEQLLLASWIRDRWRETRNGPDAPTMEPDLRRLLEGLYYRTDLPIQYAPGRYLMPIDHAAVIARIQQAQANGEDWLQVINPNDALGTARMHIFDGRPTMRDARGRYREGTDRERAFASPDGYNLTAAEVQDLRNRAAAGDVDARNQIRDIDERRQVIRDNLRFFENPDDPLIYMAYFESLAREMEARNMLGGPATRDQLTRRALGMFNELLMNDAEDLSQGVASMWARMNDVQRIDTELPAFVTTVQLALQGQLRQVHTLANRAVQTNNPADFALLQRAFFDLQMLRFHMRKTKTAMGRGLKALDPAALPNAAELRDLRDARQFLQANGFEDDIGRPLAETLARIDPDLDPNAAIRILNDVWQPGAMQRGNLLMEIYRNGLLSLPRSWFGLQVVSPMITLGVEGMQKLVMSGIRGDILTASQTLANLPRMVANAGHGIRFAARTFVTEQPTLLPRGTGIVQDTFVPAIHSDQNNIIGMSVNTFGRGIRLPQNFIATIDEFWKQVTARTEMQSLLYRRIMQDRMQAAGVNGWRETIQFMAANHRAVTIEADAMGQQYIRNGALRDRTMIGREALNDPVIAAEGDPLRRATMMNDYINHHWDENQRDTVAEIGEAANRQSYTEPLPGLAGAVRHHLQQHWWLQLIVPFYTAPMNILRRAWGYMSSPIMFGGDIATGLATERRFRLNPDSRLYRIHHQTMLDMQSGDPARMSRAQGQILVGMSFLAGGYSLFSQGRITGNGPMDPEQKRLWQESGRKPYSIKIGDRWYAYKKLDPFGMLLGWVADYHELTTGMYENDEEDVLGPATAIAYALTTATINKSYMQTLDMLLEANDDPVKMERVLARLGVTTFPVTGIGSSLQAGTLQAMDPNVTDPLGGVKADEGLGKEVELILNEMRAKSWWGQIAGGRESMALRYSALGEPIKSFDPAQDYPWVDFVSPVQSSADRKDAVVDAMLAMPHIWRSAPPNKDGMNLKQIRVAESRRTAYDLYNENIASVKLPFSMEGSSKKLTLRQALQHIVDGKGVEGRMFKSMNDNNPENYPGDNPPNIAMFVRVIERYRTAAWNATVASSAELRERIDERRKTLIDSRKRDIKQLQDSNSQLKEAVEAASQ